MKYRSAYRLSGWLTIIVATIVYFFSVQRTGSLWDCGEFIAGAYKLEVVHPPGAPLFLLIGHLFAKIGEWFSSDPADIAFMVNLLSGLSAAFAVGFLAWSTFLFGKLALVGRDGETTESQNIALAIAGIVAGLVAAFSVSVYFSAVEGEVYAMSFFFTCLVLWAMTVWYAKPNEKEHDRWIVFALYATGLSIGVHLLSLLIIPTAALLYYFKKYDKINAKGVLASLAIGGAVVVFIMKFVIVGVPTIWAWFDKIMVNSLGMGFNTGIIPTILLLAGVFAFGLHYSHKRNSHILQLTFMAALLVVISFSTVGVVVVRANAKPPINMNNPQDPFSLLPYLNREQYGERPIIYGPAFDVAPTSTDIEPRYGRVGDKYEVTGYKMSYVYKQSDKSLFPRMGHTDRESQYRNWIGRPSGSPTMADNLSFFFSYQVNWMYWRYFMWNFVGRTNAKQGYTPANKADGQWASGIKFIDKWRLYDMDKEPEWMKNDESRNSYYFIPLILGIVGMVFSYKYRRKDFFALMTMFFITGLGIILYSNQPPQEPRERDYVLIGSFATFAIWIGLSVLAIYGFLGDKLKNMNKNVLAVVAGAIVLIAPMLMGFQNYDDMGRRHLYASRDYASNFLNSVEENAIIFTYGDNDTYPLWYAQEVEDIRTDVRVINLSLIAVDWYIDLMRRRVDKSAAIDMSIAPEQYRGYRHDQLFLFDRGGGVPQRMLTFNQLANEINSGNTELRDPSRGMSQFGIEAGRFSVPIDKNNVKNIFGLDDSLASVATENLLFDFRSKTYLRKDELAILDIIASNINKRPIYFATTIQSSKMLGLNDYVQLEGLALRIIPVKSESDQRLSIFGSGRIDSDKVLNNAKEKFMWGGFDKKDIFVDESFGPAVQSHRLVFYRALMDFMKKGETGKAEQMSDLFFEGFPNMNFPYGYFEIPFISPYVENGKIDRAQELIDIALENVTTELDFYSSLDQSIVNSSFSHPQNVAMSSLFRLNDVVKDLPDSAKKDNYVNTIEQYMELLR